MEYLSFAVFLDASVLAHNFWDLWQLILGSRMLEITKIFRRVMPPDRPRGRGQRPLKVTGNYFYPNMHLLPILMKSLNCSDQFYLLFALTVADLGA